MDVVGERLVKRDLLSHDSALEGAGVTIAEVALTHYVDSHHRDVSGDLDLTAARSFRAELMDGIGGPHSEGASVRGDVDFAKSNRRACRAGDTRARGNQDGSDEKACHVHGTQLCMTSCGEPIGNSAPGRLASLGCVLQIVFTEEGVGLTKDLSGWRVLQSRFPSYKASLGPSSVDEIDEYFDLDYSATGRPFSRDQIAAFVADSSETDVWAYH
ncbi:MAG: hypothetical protein JWN62_1842 [Acidimicrobiales bacterium]|nr:hypothetical protein [Acidimicrobiales bacterium]